MPNFFNIFAEDIKVTINKKIMARKIIKNEDYFDEINTELKAYLLGFFLADGCIVQPSSGNKCISMCLQEQDEYVLEWFLKEIAPNGKISRHKKKSTGKVQCNIKFTSKVMSDKLEEIYGIKPRKTRDINFTFPFDKIPNDLIHHFIRGFFDGDGWITEYSKDSNGGTLVPQFGFVSTSLPFILQLKEILPKFTEPRIITQEGKNSTYYQLIYSCGHERVPLIKAWLYHKANYYLQRKYDKFKENSELTSVLKTH